MRTAELTLPGFRHDVGSAVHPAALSSPFFRAFRLRDRIDWVTPEVSYAQPLDGGRAGIAWRDIDRTADGLGPDARAWLAVLRPLSSHLDAVVDFTGSQLLRMPRHPLTTVRFGLRVLQLGLDPRARHVHDRGGECASGRRVRPRQQPPAVDRCGRLGSVPRRSRARGRRLGLSARGRAADRRCADRRPPCARRRVVETDHVASLDRLGGLDWGDPAAGDLLLLDTSPRLLLTHPDMPASLRPRDPPATVTAPRRRRSTSRWTDRFPGTTPTSPGRRPCTSAGRAPKSRPSENAVARGGVGRRPYVLAVQPSVLDPTRAPVGEGRAVGVHACPRRLAAGPDRARDAAGRAIRPRLPRPHPRRPTPMTAAEREAFNPSRHRRRHPRRRIQPRAGDPAAGALDHAVAHADARRVPRLGVHSARARRDRDARLVRRAAGHRRRRRRALDPTDLFQT